MPVLRAMLVAVCLPAVLPVGLAAQDSVELQSIDGTGAQQVRLSVSSGVSAQVKLFATFNANPAGLPQRITGLPTPQDSWSTDAATVGWVLDKLAGYMPIGTDDWVNVSGDVMTGALTIDAPTATTALTMNVAGGTGIDITAGGWAAVWRHATADRQFRIANTATTVNFHHGTTASVGANVFLRAEGGTVEFPGNVGLGTSAPVGRLHVRGWDDATSSVVLAPGADTALPGAPNMELRFVEMDGGGADYVGLRAPGSVTSNTIWTLPSGDGAAGQVLRTNGGGALSWTTPAAGTVTSIAPGAPGAPAGSSGLTFSSNPIAASGTLSIASGGVTSLHIADESVTSADILNGTVGTAELADGSVTTAKIADLSIAAADLADGAVTSAKIADEQITNADIASSTQYVSVQNSTGTQQFVVTDGLRTLQFAGSGAASISFDAASQRVTISATDTNSGGDITAVSTPPGSGLTGGGASGDLTLSIAAGGVTNAMLANTGVAPGLYGSAGSVATFTVDAQGRLTAAGNSPIAIAASQITSGTLTDAQISDTLTITGGSVAAGVIAGMLTDAQVTDALTINTTALGTFAGGLSATENGNLATSYGLYLKRNTDTTPAGYLIRGQNAAGTADLFAVNVNGVITAGTIPWGSVTGAPATYAPAAHAASHQSGGSDALSLGSIAGALTAAQHGDLSGTQTGMHHWNSITSKPATYPPSAHAHNAADITSGTLTAARGGTGISGTGGVADRVLLTTDGTSWTAGQVALGSAQVTGTLPVARGGTGADLSTTGGPGQFVRQSAQGGALSVGQITAADLPPNLYLAKNAQDASSASAPGWLYDVTNTSAAPGSGGLRGKVSPATASSGGFYGLLGEASVSDGSADGGAQGVYNYGVKGVAGGSPVAAGPCYVTNRGVYGEANANNIAGGILANHGVRGYASGTGAACFGVSGSASGTGTNYGIYGTASGGSANWAGYFDGMVAIANQNPIRLFEPSLNGTESVGLKAPDSVLANVVWTLPSADGSTGQVLTTNGAGALSWSSDLPAGSDAYIQSQLVAPQSANFWIAGRGAAWIGTGGMAAFSALEGCCLQPDAAGDGRCGVQGFITRDPLVPNAGTAWAPGTCNAGVMGVQGYGDGFTAGVFGWNNGDGGNNAGVVGYNQNYGGMMTDAVWGALGYKDAAGTTWGGYFDGMVGIANQKPIRLFEAPSNGSNYAGLKPPAALAASIEWTLPDAAGTAGQVLTRGTGDTLTWTTPVAESQIGTGAWLVFTRAKVVPTDPDSTKDGAIAAEFGSSYVAATALEVAAYFSYAAVPATERFTVAGSGSAFRILAPTTPPNPMVLSPEPPSPPGVTPPAVYVAGIHKNAPLRFTRETLNSNAADGEKDNQITASSILGPSYCAATALNVASFFRYVLPPSTAKFGVAAAPNAWIVTQASSGGPVVLSPEPPPPYQVSWPQVHIAAVRK